MKAIYLNDLLHIQPEHLDSVKVKFNQNNGYNDPMDLYLREPELINTQWLFWNKHQKYFKEGQIAVCFLKLTWDTWLLTTIKKVTKDLNVQNGICFEGEELR